MFRTPGTNRAFSFVGGYVGDINGLWDLLRAGVSFLGME